MIDFYLLMMKKETWLFFGNFWPISAVLVNLVFWNLVHTYSQNLQKNIKLALDHIHYNFRKELSISGHCDE